jgi:pre-rRNA-processing protein TSR3
MECTLPTIIIRHRRENVKKCSLRGFETRSDFQFFSYPDCSDALPDLSQYVVLDIYGEPLSARDSGCGLMLLDATWRLAERMKRQLRALDRVPKRSIPKGFQTAYPRRQADCPNPEEGLASIEALWIAYRLMGKNGDFLLDNYYWKQQFFEKNHMTEISCSDIIII